MAFLAVKRYLRKISSAQNYISSQRTYSGISLCPKNVKWFTNSTWQHLRWHTYTIIWHYWWQGKYIFHKVLYVKFITNDFYKDGRIGVLMWKQVISYSIAF